MLTRVSLVIVSLFATFTAYGQTLGTLTYSAPPATPVPLPSLLLLPLCLLLALLGTRLLKRELRTRLLGVLFLALGVGLGTVTSLHIQDVIAASAIELDDPNGGSSERTMGSGLCVVYRKLCLSYPA